MLISFLNRNDSFYIAFIISHKFKYIIDSFLSRKISHIKINSVIRKIFSVSNSRPASVNEKSQFPSIFFRKLKKAQQNILLASANYQKAIANEKQLKKENYTKEKLEIFNKQLAEFEKSVTIFIKEVEKSKSLSKEEIEKKVYTENMAGTSNDVIKKYNNLVNAYNNLMN